MPTISSSRHRGRPAIAGAIAAAIALALVMSAGAPAAGHRHRTHERAATVTVNIRSFAFHPRTLKIGRGTNVVFANRASIAHTATRRGSFDTGHIRPGHSVAVRFSQPGAYAFHCTIHPFMHGKIVVR
jgi:plastocyanin